MGIGLPLRYSVAPVCPGGSDPPVERLGIDIGEIACV
jgi:hypothetical protein